MDVCHYEDRGAADLEPLALTRPVFSLLCGLSSLSEKQARYFQGNVRGAVVRPHLGDAAAPPREGLIAVVNGRWLPPAGFAPHLSVPCGGHAGDQPPYALVVAKTVTARTPDAVEEQMEQWKAALPCRDAGGRLFQWLWELVSHNSEQITTDCAAAEYKASAAGSQVLPAIIGPREGLRLDRSARVDPFVAAHTTNGPVVIGPDAIVTAFSRLEGPCVIGARTRVCQANIRAGTTIGPDCRIGGEVECSIIQGYSNKAHDGFLGHAYLGEWVNLGAGTQTSDLRNDYQPVSVVVNGRLVRTGQTKVGCFLGDHTKTAIGTLLNTGTNAGAFCNLLPSGLLPRRIPSFSQCLEGRVTYTDGFENLLKTAAAVMTRRGNQLTPAHEALYRAVFEETESERRAAILNAERRALRRSA